jgi:hypothetical protein
MQAIPKISGIAKLPINIYHTIEDMVLMIVAYQQNKHKKGIESSLECVLLTLSIITSLCIY